MHVHTRVYFDGSLAEVGLVLLLQSMKTFMVLVIAVRVDDASRDENHGGGEEEDDGERGAGHEGRLGARKAGVGAVMVKLVKNGKAGEGNEELYGCDQQRDGEEKSEGFVGEPKYGRVPGG